MLGFGIIRSQLETFVLKHFRNFISIGAVNFKAVFHPVKTLARAHFLELKTLRGKIYSIFISGTVKKKGKRY